MKRKKKLAYGTTIEDPFTALYENQMAQARAEAKAANNPWTTGLDILGTMAMNYGTGMMQSGMADTTPSGEAASTKGFTGFLNGLFGAKKQNKAFGGTVNSPVEVEGEEVAEFPNGMMLDFKGPSHENGGIDVALPGGTEVFSKRIKVDGKTMAERKLLRQKLAEKLQKLSSENSTDLLLKNALKRNKQVSDAEEFFDLDVQKTVSDVLNPPKEKLAYGTGPYYNPALNPSLWDWQGMAMQANPSFFLDMFTPDPRSKGSASLYETESPTYSTPNYGLTNADSGDSGTDADTADKKFDWGKLFKNVGMPTLGDAIGMYGNWKQAKETNDLILENRAGDTPNINAFKDYGKDGLEVLQKSKDYVSQIRDKNLKDLESARSTSSIRNRNSARGVNTQRALDLATDTGLNKAMSDVYSSFASQMLGITGQEAQMENQQDQLVMQGEQNRDLADRMDRDNFYTQLITGRKGVNQAISTLGGNLNKIKERKTNEDLLNQMFDYAEVNVMNGTISAKEGLKLMGQGNSDNILKRPAYLEFEKAKEYEGVGYTKEGWDNLSPDQKAFVYITKKKIV